jgi:hypothetical protein
MSDKQDLCTVRRLLEDAGLHVERVPEATIKRCDLRARDDSEGYLIEVKGFHDDEAIGKALRSQGLHDSVSSYDHRNTVEDGIEEAVKQLRETAGGSEKELRLLALLVRTTDTKVTRQQILGAIYGKASLPQRGTQNHHECLYFNESAFFRNRTALDGAIVIDPPHPAFLWANDHSSRLDRVRRSRVGQFFVEKEAFYDARHWGDKGFLVADCDIPRNDSAAVIEYLEKKYTLQGLTLVEFKRWSGWSS